MTYFVSLKWAAVIVGLLGIAGHLPIALFPDRLSPVLKRLPRNYPLGVVLMLLATIWFVVLTGVMDLGEISNIRVQLMAAWTVGGVMLIIFVPGFLAARGFGCLLLLGAAVLLDATYLTYTLSADVLKILAYYWVIAGMVLVYSPHLWRNAIDYVTFSPQRLRILAWPGVVFGVLLIILGIFVYPVS